MMIVGDKAFDEMIKLLVKLKDIKEEELGE